MGMLCRLGFHHWYYVTRIKSRNGHPSIYKFVCHRDGRVKLVEGDQRL